MPEWDTAQQRCAQIKFLFVTKGNLSPGACQELMGTAQSPQALIFIFGPES